MNMLRKRFTNYETYASATLTDIFTPDELQDANRLTANQFSRPDSGSPATGGRCCRWATRS